MYAQFYKEWVKTHRIVGLIVLLFTGAVIYSSLTLIQMLRVNGATATWGNVILKDVILIPEIEYLPLIAGGLIAVAQYFPEITDKRLKLTLHLPCTEDHIILSLMAYGSFVLTAVFVLSAVVLLSVIGLFFPTEIVLLNFYTALPWFIGGYATYMLTAWILLEPAWRQRVYNTLVAGTLLSTFYMDVTQGAYQTFFIYLVLFTLLYVFLPFYSAARFKEGILN